MACVPLGCIGFELPAGRGRKARTVHQELRAQPVVLSDRCGGQVQATCLIAAEIAAPIGAKPSSGGC
jgi:hypothetical protein